jgi:hypothetical protein
MALPSSDFDQISAVSKRYFLPKLADNIFVGTPELQRAKDKSYKKVDGGTKIIAPLEYAQGNFQWYTGVETLNTSDVDTFTSASYDWRQCAAPITISRLDELKNMGDAQVVDFVKSKFKSAEKTMRQNLSLAFYNAGTDPKAPVGLRAIVATANTIGGISQTNNSWWQGQVDSSTTTLGLSALESIFMSCSEDQEQPSVAYTTKSLYGKYWALLQPQQRFIDEDSAKAGFKSLMFNGIPVLACSNAPSLHWFFVNESYIYIFAHSKEDMRMDDLERPRGQNVKSAHIFWAGAIGSTNNRYHGKLSVLAA